MIQYYHATEKPIPSGNRLLVFLPPGFRHVPQLVRETVFYSFRQNNSFGIWKDPALWVIVEADSPNEANQIAQGHGVYFRGCEDDIDCPCCGDRWSEVYEGDAMEEPGCYISGDLMEDETIFEEYTFPTHLVIYKDRVDRLWA